MIPKDSRIVKGVVYADAHAPNHCKRSVNITKQIVADEKPDYLINLGDGGDLASINWHLKDMLQTKEGMRLADDINCMITLDEEIASMAPTECKKIRHLANHDGRWIELFIEKHPELAGMEELNIKKRYEKLGWKIIPWGEFSKVGKLYFHHGDRKGYQGIWHAKSWAMTGKSIVYGHRHDIQRFTAETLESDGSMIPNAGFSIGCLGLRTPRWMDNRRNNWSNGIGIFYLRAEGYFNFYALDFIKGKCVWNGRLYKG